MANEDNTKNKQTEKQSKKNPGKTENTKGKDSSGKKVNSKNKKIFIQTSFSYNLYNFLIYFYKYY